MHRVSVGDRSTHPQLTDNAVDCVRTFPSLTRIVGGHPTLPTGVDSEHKPSELFGRREKHPAPRARAHCKRRRGLQQAGRRAAGGERVRSDACRAVSGRRRKRRRRRVGLRHHGLQSPESNRPRRRPHGHAVQGSGGLTRGTRSVCSHTSREVRRTAAVASSPRGPSVRPALSSFAPLAGAADPRSPARALAWLIRAAPSLLPLTAPFRRCAAPLRLGNRPFQRCAAPLRLGNRFLPEMRRSLCALEPPLPEMRPPSPSWKLPSASGASLLSILGLLRSAYFTSHPPAARIRAWSPPIPLSPPWILAAVPLPHRPRSRRALPVRRAPIPPEEALALHRARDSLRWFSSGRGSEVRPVPEGGSMIDPVRELRSERSFFTRASPPATTSGNGTPARPPRAAPRERR